MRKPKLFVFTTVLASLLVAADLALADPTVFTDEAAFLAASGASQRVAFPAPDSRPTYFPLTCPSAGFVPPYQENGFLLGHRCDFAWVVGDHTALLAGNEFAVSGPEHVDIDAPSLLHSFGIRVVDKTTPDPNCPGKDSSFTFTLLSGATVVGSILVDPPEDAAGFAGVISDLSFDSVEIREVGAALNEFVGNSCENDFFGPVFAGEQVPPVANAGADQSVDEGQPVQLDGTASTNATGFQWSQVAGPPVALDDDTSPTPGFTAPLVSANVTLTFSLVVDGGTLVSDPDTVDVTVVNVNNPPVADAGDDSTIKEGAVATLDGSNSFDPEGDAPLGYAWTQVAGPPVVLAPSPTVVSPTFAAPLGVGSVLEFELVVDDGREASAPDTVLVTVVANSTPVANAGSDQMSDEGTLVQLDGTGSSDADGGDTLSYQWAFLPPDPILPGFDPTSPKPSFTAPFVDTGGLTLTFELVVTDDDPVNPLSSAPDPVVVTIRNVSDPPDCDLAFARAGSLWPPDHRMQPIMIEGVMDPDSPTNPITIEITGVTQDEPVNGLGDGDSSPDAVIVDGAPADSVLIRRERAGPGDGRVYVISFTASNGTESCQGSVVLETAKSRSGDPAIDDGRLYDSTLP